jgi:hypothetical protein
MLGLVRRRVTLHRRGKPSAMNLTRPSFNGKLKLQETHANGPIPDPLQTHGRDHLVHPHGFWQVVLVGEYQ